MLKKALITGLSGFAGSHLAKLLISQKNYEVSGTYLVENSLNNVTEIKDSLDLRKINLLNNNEVFSLVNSLKPDLIFHLAALTSPAESFKNPSETFANNAVAQINLLEAVRESSLLNTKILIVSSADAYGKVSKEDLPINEDTKFTPMNSYAVSKIAQDFLGLQYYLSYNLKIIRVRPFNHIGPKQAPNFVVSSFAKRIAEIEEGREEPILLVGNLEAKRDFTDVRDMVAAYLLAIEKGKEGDVYNLGSGISYKISDILDKLLSLSKIKISVKVDPTLFRPSDEPELLCDNQKFVRLTGWKPAYSLEQTLKDTLDYWRKII